jgi:hypothetical protein
MEQPKLIGYEIPPVVPAQDKKVDDVEAKMPFLQQQAMPVMYGMPQAMSYAPQPVF